MKANSFFVCALCASLVQAEASSRLYHRIWDPSAPPPPFLPRAHVQNSQESALLLTYPDNADQLFLDSDHSEGSLYQVALQRAGDLSEDDWDLSSVKACHIAGMKSDTIIMHLSQSQQAYAIDYFVHPVPHDGSCPTQRPSSRSQISFSNTTLTIHTPGKPPLPELRAPPQLSSQGEPIQPQPEQSFIQKYWMYIALGLVTLVLTGGAAPDAEEDQRGTSGGHAAGR